MKKENIIMGTLILTAATCLTRIIGFVFRIYLANAIKSEGMGLYQLILSFYMLTTTFATSGISIAVSRLTSEELAKHRPINARKVLKQSVFLSLITGFTAFLLLYYFADEAGIYILKDERTILSLRFLAPSLPFMAVSSCFRGYFYGVRKVLKPASAQILEQLIRVFVVFSIMSAWLPKGLDYACAAIVIGMTLEEIFSCVYTFILYIFDKKPKVNKHNDKADAMLYQILGISIPVAATSYLNAILRVIENILIPSRLILYGISTAGAMSLYGMVKGMVLPILFFPSSFLTSLASVLIPSIAGANATRNEKKVTYTLSKVLHFTLLSGIVIVSIFIMFSYEIGISLYNDPQVGVMLKVISFVCPFMYLNMVIVSMLNAIGEQVSTFKVNVIESIIKISIIYFLMPIRGFDAYLIALFVSTIVNTILYIARLMQVSCIIFDVSNWIFKPILCAIISAISARFMYSTIFIFILSKNLSLVLSIVVLGILYLILLMIFNSIPKYNINDARKLLKR